MSITEALNPVEALQTAYPDIIQEVAQFQGETTIVVKPEDAPTALRYLRDTKGLFYNYLSDISAVDYYEPTGASNRPGRFGLCYHIYSMLYNRRLRVKTYVEEENPVVPTVTTLWPAANWLEREIFDLMGIPFAGHPDLRRIMMSSDWEGHPHRRDYPLGYETPQFSFNVEEIAQYKPFAKE